MISLDEYLENYQYHEDGNTSFLRYYFKLLDAKGLTNSEVYNSVNMSKATYHKILNDKMTPSLKNAVKLAIGLHCSNAECKMLLKKLGYTLASHSKFNLIIRYCMENEIYDYYDICDMLEEHNCETLE